MREHSCSICGMCYMAEGANNNCKACIKTKVLEIKECIKWREKERERIHGGLQVGFAAWKNEDKRIMPPEVINLITDFIYIKVPCNNK